MAVAGLGVGAAFAAFPAQIIAVVPAHETGSAMSVNQVLRYVGFAAGSALAATLLAAFRPTGGGAPGSSGYLALAAVGLGVCLLTAVVTWSMSRRTVVAADARPAATPVGTGG
jgi:hypothetical protein